MEILCGVCSMSNHVKIYLDQQLTEPIRFVSSSLDCEGRRIRKTPI